MTNLKPNDALGSADRWGIILSGGNGTRLRDVVYRRRADHLPKQYLNFIGKRSMLEHTLHRAEKLIPAQKLLTVIAKEHLQFDEVRHQIAARPQQCIIVQPENKDTGPGILLPLMHLHKRSPDAIVTLFPSDHFILQEDLFMQHVDRALRIVESDGTSMVLLGTEPTEPEPEYGYILPGERIGGRELDGDRTVEMFVEKPSAEAAKMIIRKGALWNTLVLVVTCKTLLQAIEHATPELYRAFGPIQNAIGTSDEQRVIERAYQNLPAVNFSKRVLETLSYGNRQNLRVLPVRGVAWNDWGTSGRLSKTLRQLGAPDFVTPAPLDSERKPTCTVFERNAHDMRRSERIL
ncbi:MAG TPA: sugar phosphate nucleotidyltransferase [Candidatus Binatia bacterium]